MLKHLWKYFLCAINSGRGNRAFFILLILTAELIGKEKGREEGTVFSLFSHFLLLQVFLKNVTALSVKTYL